MRILEGGFKFSLAGDVVSFFATSVLSEMNDHHREASKDAGKGVTQVRLLYVLHTPGPQRAMIAFCLF